MEFEVVNFKQRVSDIVLLDQFKKVEQLPEPKKKLVKEFLNAFIMKADLQKETCYVIEIEKSHRSEAFLVLFQFLHVLLNRITFRFF